MRELRQALAVATAELSHAVVGARLATLSDADLASSGGEIETAARLIDAARVLHAAEVARRAETREGMVTALGYRDGVDMVAGVARISGGAAKQRIRTGEAIAPRVSATGADIPPRFEVISAAVLTGRIGIEAAGLLITQLDSASPALPGRDLLAAEERLVDLVAGTPDRPPLGVGCARRTSVRRSPRSVRRIRLLRYRLRL